MTFGGAESGADGSLSTGVDTLNSLCGLATGSPNQFEMFVVFIAF